MASKKKRIVGAELYQVEERFAQRLLFLKGLKPGFALEVLVREFADLEIVDLPFELDGITVNLKVPGTRPRILLKLIDNQRRMKFTLAHELGHIVIPWHMGTIIDEVEFSEVGMSDLYWRHEAEANRFAGELLMPSIWVDDLIASNRAPPLIIKNICDVVGVSVDAALYRVCARLPRGHLYVRLDRKGNVIRSGKTLGTVSDPPVSNGIVDGPPRMPILDHWEIKIDDTALHWWSVNENADMPKIRPTDDWRVLLQKILDDIKEIGEPSNLWGSINGVIAATNSMVRRSRAVEELYSAAYTRFSQDKRWGLLVNHRLFSRFLASRVRELI
jgi:hypothetical protein